MNQSEAVDPGRPNRLTLAKWLVREDHPLTARVAVNRYWQMLFGRGLVSTPDDFGTQGAYPTHPALLDWLALEFQESGWDVKQLLKTILMSSTYRQSSSASRDLYTRDPENRWLARAHATVFRLNSSAMELRRFRSVGAPGWWTKRVPRPAAWTVAWEATSGMAMPSVQAFYPSDNSGQHRRSMYTF